MFNLAAFIKEGLLDAVGRQSDYLIIQNAANWLDKGVLRESELKEIQDAIEKKNDELGLKEEAKIASKLEANTNENTESRYSFDRENTEIYV